MKSTATKVRDKQSSVKVASKWKRPERKTPQPAAEKNVKKDTKKTDKSEPKKGGSFLESNRQSTSTFDKKDDDKDGDKDEEENLYNQPTPELLELSDVTEGSVQIVEGRQHQPSTSAKTEKATKKKNSTEPRERKVHKSMGKKKISAKKSKSNVHKSPSGSASSRGDEKKKIVEEDSKKLSNVEDTTDRLKDWISSLNVLSSKEFNAVRNEEAMPSYSLDYVCQSRISCESSVSRIGERRPRPLPVKEAETQTLVDQEAQRRKRKLIEEKISRRQDEFQQHFHILVERQYYQAAKIWRIGREMQQLTNEASVAVDWSELSYSESTGNHISSERQPSGSIACGREFFAGSSLDNARQDSLDSSVTNAAPTSLKALGWLEEELLHHECMEKDFRDVPRGVQSHAPCLYGNGFIQKRETRSTTARVAFVDDFSVDGRNLASMKGTLKKRLKWFRKSIRVRKKTPKRREQLKAGLRRTYNGQYFLLVLIVFAQFVAQLWYS